MGQKITGYRDLTEDELAVVNEIKRDEGMVAETWLNLYDFSGTDKRWLAIAKTHMQEGFSALVRSVTKPVDPFVADTTDKDS